MNECPLKVGDRFTHARFLDDQLRPAECVVTAKRYGLVYWRRPDGDKAEWSFCADQWERSVMPGTIERG